MEKNALFKTRVKKDPPSSTEYLLLKYNNIFLILGKGTGTGTGMGMGMGMGKEINYVRCLILLTMVLSYALVSIYQNERRDLKVMNHFKNLIQMILFLIAICPLSYAYASYRFVVYADSRAVKKDPALFNHAILGFINSQVRALHPKPKFALFIGDMVNQGWTNDYTHNNLLNWKAFMKAGLGDIPLYVAVGNTDLYGSTGWTEYPLQDQFRHVFSYLPDNGPHNYKKLAYAFEYGKGREHSLFIVMDSFGFFQSSGKWVNFDNGFDREQIHWISKMAKKSNAVHKFGVSHGPAFSVEGFPVSNSVKEVWKIMEKNKFDMFYCGHEHIFSRWTIGKSVYPESIQKLTQTIVGSAGATPDSASMVKVNPIEAHIYSGYTFVVVDVKEDHVIQRAYAVIPNGTGFSATQIDKFVIKK